VVYNLCRGPNLVVRTPSNPQAVFLNLRVNGLAVEIALLPCGGQRCGCTTAGSVCAVVALGLKMADLRLMAVKAGAVLQSIEIILLLLKYKPY